MRSKWAWALLLGLTACVSQTPIVANRPAEKPILILISFDGFRWDYPEKAPTPNLQATIKKGVRAERLIPSFPTKTFSNHFTIVTGVYPAHHGVISNRFFDPKLNATFNYRDSICNQDPRWWNAEPLWITAEKQGHKAACFFWTGSEVKYDGVRPSYWKHYEHMLPGDQRVDTVLSWLANPEERRPDFITLYFSKADEIGHSKGPNSNEILGAITHLDSMLGRLQEGIRKLNLENRVNIVIVSDHGMAQTSPDSVVFLDDYVRESEVQAQMETPFVALRPKDGDVDRLYKRLFNAHSKMKVYTKATMPERLHFAGNDRIADVICVAEEGWSISNRDYWVKNKSYFVGGTHGYEPGLLSMGGTFIASGPAFREGIKIPPVENVHLYALMARILGIVPRPNDGDENALKNILK